MLEYEFEEVSCGEVYGFYLRETAAHREVIVRRAADGWRYVGCIPKSQRRPYGFIEGIDLVFERQPSAARRTMTSR